jgi:hypothetical protein
MRDDIRQPAVVQIIAEMRAHLERKFEKILVERSEVVQELFEVGIISRLVLDPGPPIDVRLERIRNEMEALAFDLQAQLPGLPRKYRKTHRRLKGIASRCNSLSARYSNIQNDLP